MNEFRLLREFTPIDYGQPTADDVTVRCSDSKFQEAYKSVLDNRGIVKPDVITRPGPSIKIATGEVTEEILDLHALHNLSAVHILDHVPCGKFMATGEYEGLDSEEEMLEVHERKLDVACAVIHEVLPSMTIVTYVLNAEEVISERVRMPVGV